jgi:hypothetical protein
MSYSVVWVRTALNQLAAISVASSDRAGVTSAAHWLERELGRRPLTLGESRTASVVRIAHRRPLGVEFEIIEDDKKVRVLRVWSLI